MLKIIMLLMVTCLAFGEDIVDHVTRIREKHTIWGQVFTISLAHSFSNYSLDSSVDVDVLRQSLNTGVDINITYDIQLIGKHYWVITKASLIPIPKPVQAPAPAPKPVPATAPVPVNVEK